MPDRPDSPEQRARIVQAFAARARIDLTDAELERLIEYVESAWDMADRLRDVEQPGREGIATDLPLRSAWANVGDRGAPPAGVAVEASLERMPSSVLEAASLIASGSVTPLELVSSQLALIDRHDAKVRSYISLDHAGATAAASSLTEELSDGAPRSPLHGVPFGAKDSIPAAGMPCTYNSPLMRDWIPARDAEAVRLLREAGAVLVGKHNLNEFGWSIPSEDDLAPPPRNPWLPEEYSVGSSSGSAAAVAAGLASFAIGTDGGGSIRLPAGQHSLFGLKPTHDRISRLGVSDGSVSEIGILTKTAGDGAAVLAVLFGDSASNRVADVSEAPARLRVGLPTGYLDDIGMEDDVRGLFDSAIKVLEEAGHEVVQLPAQSLGLLHDALRANFVLIAAEHYFDHEGPGRDRSRYGASAGFYNLPGACLTAADYMHALRVGKLVCAEVDAVFQAVDMLLTPTSPVTRTSTARNPHTHRRGANAAYTAPFNLTGHPALSVPVGLSSEGLPIGLQLVGPMNSEFALLQAGGWLSSRFELPEFPVFASSARFD